LPVRDPTTCIELWCHAASSTQTHLTGVWPRELLCFGSGALRSWDPMVVETWIEMLREELKHISPYSNWVLLLMLYLGPEHPVCVTQRGK
jgi:hypothetical protein